MILLDTDVCIELLRGNKKILERREQCDDSIAISFMTVAGLFFGVWKSSERQRNMTLVEQFLMTMQIINSDSEIMSRFGEIKADLSAQNNMLPDADIFIAATALVRCEKLISGNIRHFNRIGGLRVDNWIR